MNAHHRRCPGPRGPCRPLRGLGDEGADAMGGEVLSPQLATFGDDGGVPGPAARGDGAGQVVGKDGGQRETPPPEPALEPEIAAASIRSRGIAEAPAITLNRMYHWVPSTISGESQISDRDREDDPGDRQRKQKIGREGRHHLRHRLQRARPGAAAGRSRRRSAPRSGWRAAISTSTRARVGRPSRKTETISRVGKVLCPLEDEDRRRRPDRPGSARHAREGRQIGRPRSASGTAICRSRRSRWAQRSDASKPTSTGRVTRSIRRERCSTVSIQGRGCRVSSSSPARNRSRPGDQRAEQHLVVDQDDGQHRRDRPEDRRQIPRADRDRDVGADPRQQQVGRADIDRLAGHHEEPAARHRHHHVPDRAPAWRRALPAARTASRRRSGGCARPRSRSSGMVFSD